MEAGFRCRLLKSYGDALERDADLLCTQLSNHRVTLRTAACSANPMAATAVAVSVSLPPLLRLLPSPFGCGGAQRAVCPCCKQRTRVPNLHGFPSDLRSNPMRPSRIVFRLQRKHQAPGLSRLQICGYQFHSNLLTLERKEQE